MPSWFAWGMDPPVWVLLPLECDAAESRSTSRALHAWADLQSAACHHHVLAWLAGREQCAALFELVLRTACHLHLRPATLLLFALSLLLALLAAAWSAISRMLRWVKNAPSPCARHMHGISSFMPDMVRHSGTLLP